MSKPPPECLRKRGLTHITSNIGPDQRIGMPAGAMFLLLHEVRQRLDEKAAAEKTKRRVLNVKKGKTSWE